MQQADRRKYHYIYKITRDDGRYYIGMHSTDNLDDGYFGSGKLITRSVKQHGVEKHKKEILEFLSSRISLKERERQLVNEEIVSDPKCMNIALGGHPSGFFTKAQQVNASIAGNRSSKRDHKVISEKILQTKRERNSFNRSQWGNWQGRKHSEETKAKMKATIAERACGIGEKNSQFGSCWVTNGVKPIKIKKEQLDEFLARGYSQGRKVVDGTA